MTAILLDRLPVMPFVDTRLPGLAPLDDADWITDQPDGPAQLAYRAELIDTRRDEVIAMLPQARTACDELYRDVTGKEAGEDPLGDLGRRVTEDFCILDREEGAEEYRLVAAVLCFPSHWVLAEKMGQPLTEIHGPVPDYDGDLARRVNRVFEAIRPAPMLVRHNWMLHSSPELFAPLGQAAAGGEVYLRSERQTFRRLKGTGAVVFGIRTSVMPVTGLEPEEARALLAAMDAQSPETVAYKGGAAFYVWAREVVVGLAREQGPAQGA